MRGLFVFPGADLETTRRRIEAAALPDDDEVVDVLIDDDPLYDDWGKSARAALKDALGEIPGWRVEINYTRNADVEELRSLVLALLGDGGVAVQDFGDDCWTADEIAGDEQ